MPFSPKAVRRKQNDLRQAHIDIEQASRTVQELTGGNGTYSRPRGNGPYSYYSREENSVHGNDIPRDVGGGGGGGGGGISVEQRVEICITKFWHYENRGGNVGYDDTKHPIQWMDKLGKIGSDSVMTEMPNSEKLTSRPEYDWEALVINLDIPFHILRILPRIISQLNMNIEDVAADATDKVIQIKILRSQREWWETTINLLKNTMLSLGLVTSFFTYLANGDNFKALFLQEADGSCGFKSNNNKNALSAGMWFVGTYGLEHYGRAMDEKSKDTAIKVLRKLSRLIDSKDFGNDGALSQIGDLIRDSEDETHKNILYNIVRDILRRQEVNEDTDQEMTGSINGY